ncbi:DUF2569 domain-containing protein [Vibrio sp. PP-XX7]
MKHPQTRQGISGWLILVAIAVTLAPVRLSVDLFSLYSKFFSSGYWSLLSHPTSELYAKGFTLWFLLLVALDLLRLAGFIYLIFVFYSKKVTFPKLYILLLIANVVLTWLEMRFISHFSMMEAKYEIMVSTLLAAFVWIPYMLRSQRVKNTFVIAQRKVAAGRHVFVIFVVLCVGSGVYFYRINLPYVAKKTALVVELSEIADEVNRTASKQSDNDIQFDSIVAHEVTLEYRYTLPEYEKQWMNVAKFSAVMLPKVVQESCENQSILELMDKGAIFRHIYFDMNGERVASVDIDQTQCPQHVPAHLDDNIEVELD